jgi:hypothetical protein
MPTLEGDAVRDHDQFTDVPIRKSLAALQARLDSHDQQGTDLLQELFLDEIGGAESGLEQEISEEVASTCCQRCSQRLTCALRLYTSVNNRAWFRPPDLCAEELLMSARLMIQAARVCPTISGLPTNLRSVPVALDSLAAQREITATAWHLCSIARKIHAHPG